MSCTLMYQPYAMSYSPYCDTRTTPDKRGFKFSHIPSPPDSLHSDGSSYSSPGPLPNNSGISPLSSLSSATSALGSSSSSSARSLNPSNQAPSSSSSSSATSGPSSSSSSSRRPLTPLRRPSATITSSSAVGASASGSSGNTGSSSSLHHSFSPAGETAPLITSDEPSALLFHHPHFHHPSHHHLNIITESAASRSTELSSSSSHRHSSSSAGPSSSLRSSETSATATITSVRTVPLNENSDSNDEQGDRTTAPRAQYLSANCVVFLNYNGDAASEVEQHFNRSLTASYNDTSSNSDKNLKYTPMSSRNLPASFWNSAYQPQSKLLAGYSSDFYGSAMDYGSSLSGFTHPHHHHSQTDPWHYPALSHQSYHHRATELPYHHAMSSASRFNSAQYSSFLFPGPASTASATSARFPPMPGTSQCAMKTETSSPWGNPRYPGHHESSWHDFHLADYSAAAAAHYSNMTAAAGLDIDAHYLQST